MSTYEGFAQIYNLFMQDAPYGQWLALLRQNWTLASLDVADIGCGTGALTIPLSFETKTCVGVDASESMLAQAQARAIAERSRVNWLCQDIRQLRLPRLTNLVVSSCDVVNYLLSQGDLRAVFSAVYQALSPQGAFAFDAIGPTRVEALRDGYFHQIEEDAVMLHETKVKGNHISHEICAFVSTDDGLYERIEEQHTQMYFTPEEISDCLRACGFQIRNILADFQQTDLATADRVIYLAEKS